MWLSFRVNFDTLHVWRKTYKSYPPLYSVCLCTRGCVLTCFHPWHPSVGFWLRFHTSASILCHLCVCMHGFLPPVISPVPCFSCENRIVRVPELFWCWDIGYRLCFWCLIYSTRFRLFGSALPEKSDLLISSFQFLSSLWASYFSSGLKKSSFQFATFLVEFVWNSYGSIALFIFCFHVSLEFTLSSLWQTVEITSRMVLNEAGL